MSFASTVMDPALAAHVEELRKVLASLAQAMPNGLDIGTPQRLAAMRSGIAAAAAGVEPRAHERLEWRKIAGPGGEIRLRILRPAEIDAVYLHLHGGGWVLGAPEMDDPTNWELARAVKAAVVSVDYRLAPECPYPAAPDDCEAAALWLLENAEREFGSGRLLIGGESVGAHLSAVTLLRLRDRHDAVGRFAGANLVYGTYDLGMTPSQRNAVDTPMIFRQDVEIATGYFLPEHAPEQRRDPDISPLFADLKGLPPALFTVGTRDRLLDDSLFMAARWQAAGNPAELAVYPEAFHGFAIFPIAMARAALERIRRFASQIIGAGEDAALPR